MALREPPRGILLVQGGVAAAVSWAESGVSPLAVVPEDGRWTAVLPVGEMTKARRPYEDAMTMLLNRPVPHRLRPAVGVGVVGRRTVLCVTPGRWRAVRRWLVWQPGHGVVHPGGLPVARLADVVAAAGVDDPGAIGELADVLHDPAGNARAVAGDLLTVLGLPGGTYLDGSAETADAFGASVVAPKPAVVRRYDKAVRDDVSWRDEMEDQQR
ncbi:MAG: hypothetical protein ABJA74_16840 [Lapillicoccus sp.]